MNPRCWIITGALLGALGVSLGAYHAHGLKSGLEKLGVSPGSVEFDKRIDNFGTAVRYQMYHVPALMIVGLCLAHGRSLWLAAAGGLLLLGVLIFSGLLYAIALGGPKILGAIVPIGGLSLILGWLALGVGAARGLSKTKLVHKATPFPRSNGILPPQFRRYSRAGKLPMPSIISALTERYSLRRLEAAATMLLA